MKSGNLDSFRAVIILMKQILSNTNMQVINIENIKNEAENIVLHHED